MGHIETISMLMLSATKAWSGVLSRTRRDYCFADGEDKELRIVRASSGSRANISSTNAEPSVAAYQ